MLTLRKSWLLVTVVAVGTALAVAFFTLGQTKIYEANSTVLFDPQPPRPLGDRVEAVVDTGQGYWTNKEYYKTQYWVIQSLRVTSEVVRSLSLNKDPGFLDNLPPGRATSPREVSIEDAASVLQSRLSVEPVRDSRLASIKYQDADPQRARRVLSSLVESYVQRNLDDMLESSNGAADWLRSQLGSLKDDLEASEMRLHDYKKDRNILSLSMDDQSNILRDEMKTLSDAATQVRRQREEVRARQTELLKITPGDPMSLPATELISSPMLQMLREAFITASQEVEGLQSEGKGENHPSVRVATARQDTARRALFEEVKNVQGAVARDLAELDHQEAGLKQLYSDAESRALDLNLLEIEYNRLARARDNNEKLYSLVMERSKESDLTRTLMFNNIRVVEQPTLPRRPVSPNVPLNLAAGMVAGLVLGLAAAFGREQLDRSIKTPDDVERTLGLSFLGLLPSLANPHVARQPYGRRRGRKRETVAEDPGSNMPELVVHQHPSSGIAEAARAIRTNILFMSPDRPYRTLLVTSAGPAEGKTTVACCIATAIAQAGRRVVLLDCDMRRPRLHKVFGHKKDVGVTTALLDPSSADSVAMETLVPNLYVVTAGPLPPNPAELLHSEAFARLLATLRERFDCVVIDSPPVVPVTDAAVLSAAVDGTILVVRAFQTSKDLAKRAGRALRDVGGHLVGVVLNAVDLDRHEYGYRYYYYYKREGYASEEANDQSPTDSAA